MRIVLAYDRVPYSRPMKCILQDSSLRITNNRGVGGGIANLVSREGSDECQAFKHCAIPSFLLEQ